MVVLAALVASAVDAAPDGGPVSFPAADRASFLQTVDDLVPIGLLPAMNVQTGAVFQVAVFQVAVVPAVFQARDEGLAVPVVDTEM